MLSIYENFASNQKNHFDVSDESIYENDDLDDYKISISTKLESEEILVAIIKKNLKLTNEQFKYSIEGTKVFKSDNDKIDFDVDVDTSMFVIRKIIDLKSIPNGQNTGIFKFEFAYADNKSTTKINNNNHHRFAVITDGKVSSFIRKPDLYVFAGVSDNGKQIKFTILDNNKNSNLNQSFLKDNNNFEITIGSNDITEDNKKVSETKIKKIKEGDEFDYYEIIINLENNDTGSVNFLLKNYKDINDIGNLFKGSEIKSKIINKNLDEKDVSINVEAGVATCQTKEECIFDINQFFNNQAAANQAAANANSSNSNNQAAANQAAANANSSNSNNSKDEVNLPLVIGVSVGGFVLLAIIVYYFMGKGRGSGRGKGKKSSAKSNNLSNKKGGSRKGGRGKSK
jgi:hypothetical protein